MIVPIRVLGRFICSSCEVASVLQSMLRWSERISLAHLSKLIAG